MDILLKMGDFMKKSPVVIAISAVSGGGKTTTINELSKKLTSQFL